MIAIIDAWLLRRNLEGKKKAIAPEIDALDVVIGVPAQCTADPTDPFCDPNADCLRFEDIETVPVGSYTPTRRRSTSSVPSTISRYLSQIGGSEPRRGAISDRCVCNRKEKKLFAVCVLLIRYFRYTSI